MSAEIQIKTKRNIKWRGKHKNQLLNRMGKFKAQNKNW